MRTAFGGANFGDQAVSQAARRAKRKFNRAHDGNAMLKFELTRFEQPFNAVNLLIIGGIVQIAQHPQRFRQNDGENHAGRMRAELVFDQLCRGAGLRRVVLRQVSDPGYWYRGQSSARRNKAPRGAKCGGGFYFVQRSRFSPAPGKHAL